MEYLTSVQSSEMVTFIDENAHGILNSLEIFNEDAQLTTSAVVIDNMLKKTMNRCENIDFSEIEKSKGDVTQCRFYKNLTESIEILVSINKTTGNLPGAIIVSDALNNLSTRKGLFTNAFRVKNSMGIILYNSMYCSIMEATSYLIASAVDFSRNGSKMDYKAVTFNNHDNLLLNNLVKFNAEVKNGNVDKFISTYKAAEQEIADADATKTEAAINTSSVWETIGKLLGKTVSSNTTGAVSGRNMAIGKVGVTIVAVLYLATHIIPIIKTCIHAVFCIRHKISEAAKIQADFIQGNIELMKDNDEGSDEAIHKQEKWVALFRKIQDTFALTHDKGNRDATNEEKHEEAVSVMI